VCGAQLNKALTVLLNIAMWDKHASTTGTLALLACLVAGLFYQQAPKRKSPASLVATKDQV